MAELKNKINPNFSMSSMADLIFLLLVFFMITSTFATTNALILNLPSTKNVPSKERKAKILIYIDKNNNLYYDGKPTSLRAIEYSILAKRRILKNISITLYADKSVPIQKVIDVMDIAQKYNLKIVLATTETDI